MLLAHGCNPRAAAIDDTNALHFAAQRGHALVVGALLEDKKVPVDSRTRKGATALHMAAQRGHADVVKLLLAKGADAGAKDRRGQTPLDLARSGEVRAMIEARVSPAGQEAAAAHDLRKGATKHRSIRKRGAEETEATGDGEESSMKRKLPKLSHLCEGEEEEEGVRDTMAAGHDGPAAGSNQCISTDAAGGALTTCEAELGAGKLEGGESEGK